MLIHLLLTSSNLIAIPTVINFYNQGKLLSSLCVTAVMGASILMHLTESKHNLTPKVLARYSSHCLNLDRLVAIIVGCYCGYKFLYLNKTEQMTLLPGALSASVAAMIGEIKTNNYYHNNIIYPLFHLYWHYQVYQLLKILL